MIRVSLGNGLKRETVIVSESTTLRQAIRENGMDYSRGYTHLDGVRVMPEDFDKTFAELGITDECRLLNVVKADNA